MKDKILDIITIVLLVVLFLLFLGFASSQPLSGDEARCYSVGGYPAEGQCFLNGEPNSMEEI